MKRSDTIVRKVPGERFTPYALAKKLGAVALLESASFDKGRERFSLLMVREAFRVEEREGGIFVLREGQRYRVRSRASDILDVLRYFADQHEKDGYEFPFPAGGVGFLGYEFCTRCDTIRLRDRRDPLGLPLASFILGHVFIVCDHYSDALHIIGLNYDEHGIDLERAVSETEAKLGDMDFNYLAADERTYSVTMVADRLPRPQHRAGVERILREIVDGNLLQAVPSRRIEVNTYLPAIEAYRRLRAANPAPYLFYIAFGDFELFGASPEVHVRVQRDEVTIRPIAGTRRRGETDEEDADLERELLADVKERAEHMMLVDLARNDIGRVCDSVYLSEFMAVERYSRVMHIVSEARGNLAGGRSGIDALRATFPAGTVSGAPKIRAIETVDAIEPHRRGFYAGVVGYLEPGGSLDTCIAIRCALKRGDTMVLQAGGGVVYDSTPDREYEETQEKLSALMRAIGLEVQS